jgi:hypothetical protein
MNGRWLLCLATIYIRREVLAHSEEWQTLRSHLDGGSRSWIPPLVSFVAANLECAKATYLDALTLAQRLLHAAEDGTDKILGLGPAHLGPNGDSFNQVISGHSVDSI